MANKLPFEKIHSLPVLLKICQKNEKSFAELTSDCKFLTEFYLEDRYPEFGVSSKITLEIAEKAKVATEKIREFVLKRLS